ncbi:MAG: zf-HC2 domain-containing protein [Armatimonadota bacterium]
MHNLDCDAAREMIHLRLDGELSGEQAELLGAHLASCGSCRAFEAELGRIDAALREGLAAAELSVELAPRVRARLAPRPQVRRAWATWLPAAAAFVLAALGVVVALSRGAPRAEAAPAVLISGGDAIHVFEPHQRTAQPGRTGEALREESIAWGAGGETVGLQFAGGARIDLGEEAVVRIGRDSVDLFKGSLRADLTRAKGTFAVVTPWGKVSGTGALFVVYSNPDGATARLSVVSGRAQVEERGSVRLVEEGQTIVLEPDPGRVLEL